MAKPHNRYKNVVRTIDCMLLYVGAHSTRDITRALRSALYCLKSQKRHIEKLEAQLEV